MIDVARAVRFDEYGGIEVLHVSEVEVPSPGPGDVQVRVRAAGINPGEAVIRSGALAEALPATFPSGQGSDLAGVVTAVGDGVRGVAVSDEVIGFTNSRASHAEYVTVPAENLTPKPAGVSFEVAGSLFVAGAAAYASVRAVNPKDGETVLVSGAAGGVGAIAVQLAALRGARVIGVASPANHGWLSSVGVIPVAYGDGLTDAVRAVAPDGVDAVIDTYGGGYVALVPRAGCPRGPDQHHHRLRRGGGARGPRGGHLVGGRRRYPGRARRTDRRRSAHGADRRHLHTRAGPRGLQRRRAPPHPWQDRPQSLGVWASSRSLRWPGPGPEVAPPLRSPPEGSRDRVCEHRHDGRTDGR